MTTPRRAAPTPLERDFLSLHARAFGAKPAVVDDRGEGRVRTLSWAELEAYANRLANGLLALGALPGDAVLWCGRNSLEALAMTHAARRLGLVGVPLNYRLSPAEAAYVIDDSDAAFVFADAEFAPRLASLARDTPKVRHTIVFGGQPEPGQTAEAGFLGEASPPPTGPPEVPAGLMLYTSGTTGRPKGAVKRSSGSTEQMRALLERIGFGADGVHLTTGPLYHSGPGGFATRAAIAGQTIVVQHRFDPEDWLRLVDRWKVTTTFAAPTPIRMICDLPAEVKARYDVSSLASLIANAAPWPQALKRAYLRDFPARSLWEIYGSTELGVNTILPPEDQLRKPGSCGRAAPLVEIALFDDDGRRIEKPFAPGQLYVRASSVFDTYHKSPELFLAEHRPDGFHTVGDVAYFDDEGYFYICDRVKDVIITGGMNVYPAEVEGALEAHGGIFEAAVIGIPSERWGEAVHACVVRARGEAGARLTAEDVQAFAREHLAGYKIPRSVEFLEELPRTGSGKVLKRELRERPRPGTRA